MSRTGNNATRAGVLAASRVVASVMRTVAAKYTARGAAAVSADAGDDMAIIRSGEPGGEWGWTPINVWELDNNGRHPFYGDRAEWYSENNKKHGGRDGLITEQTVETGADDATEAFADAYVDEFFS